MSRFAAGVAIAVIAAIVMLAYGMQKYGVFALDAVDDDDLAQRYRLVCGAYADVEIDASHVPAELHALLPLARKYGHVNRLLLDDCARRMDPKEAAQAVWEIDRHRAAIDRWLERSAAVAHVTEVSAFASLLYLRRALRPVVTTSDSAG